MADQTVVQKESVRDTIRNANEWLVGVGILMIIFCLLCTLLEVQTSEAAILHGGGMTQLVVPQMSTFMQLWDLVAGKLTPLMIVVTLWGWGSQITYFACIVGWRHFHKSIARHNQVLAMICVAVAVCVALYNCVTDYNYVGLVINDFWWQCAITSIIALGAATFGIAGLHFIKAGIGKE